MAGLFYCLESSHGTLPATVSGLSNTDVEQLLAAADMALYGAKQGGRHRACTAKIGEGAPQNPVKY